MIPVEKAERPAGNSWNAKVITIRHEQDPPGFKLKLIEPSGSCISTSHEGKKDQVVEIPFHSNVEIGQVVEIWLYPAGKASWEKPKCE